MAPPVVPSFAPLLVELVPLSPSSDYGYLAVIRFNRPDRANALSPEAYLAWSNALTWTADTEEVRAVILTGNGRFYCSGQELSLPSKQSMAGDEFEQTLRRRARVTEQLVGKFIDFPKLLVAAVNGPAYGFGVTHLALCDAVYATEEATFRTPFMELGFCAEGCSSVLFPRQGEGQACHAAQLMGRQFSAKTMAECQFVSQVLPSDRFLQHVLDIVVPAARYPIQAVRQSKALIMSAEERAFLHEVNRREMALLVERMLSEECHNAMIKFLATMQKRTRKQASPASSSKL
ncbi:hypothetical protein SYNPS1DRAFT_17423 [Syncephalis pseudoplumigaleata]|uniref:ClpP/crotonase-like domain-containing protein n=1 Tax=Syncephalis pseudoplumigaleata TaxID=1712513 RepID=A0A4P9YXN3_9FUNG|nr:hypothetical protein SYNPS1DRAFT_17423 [Syncephalis pseudoplumigaleata]|eukprot:RKP24292.1 hypothetical protein SYNPS1DRAFT_17423 [Syncephalis pseudoplumigaleata]